MTGNERTDGWETLRRRLEQTSGARWRGTWVPTRHSPTDPEPIEPTPGSPVPLAPPPGRHPLRPAHLAVVVLVTAAALVGTVLVLASAQPSTQQVDRTADVGEVTPAATAPATPAAATPTGSAAGDAAGDAAGVSEPTDGQMPPAAAGPGPGADVVVHVAGKVRRPGVVRLPAGSRVIDAVEAAGGALPKARLASVNLARVLTDGEQVLVGLPASQPASGSAGSATSSAPQAGATVDLNRASAAELETLPGVGPVLAGRIVAYRDENGPFISIDQLIEVPGIGPAVLSGLADQARV